jgi:hypothetical protein
MINRSTLRLSRLTLGLAAALLAAPAFAQQTSSALSGTIVGADGMPVAGAEVIISHTASGTVSRVTTDDSGRYNARGLRVGGPYTVIASKDGFQSQASENVQLPLGQTAFVSMTLESATRSLDTIQVVGVGASDVFATDRMGAGTAINRETLEAMPSLQRNLQDYARLDARVAQTDKDRGEISAGGQNVRFNSITIDGVTTNDTFGLEANNLPTAKQPISIDAIESVQINVSNYDVSQKGYTGANINAVTRSGTNDFKGSVYYVYRDDDLVGRRYNRSTDSYVDAPAFDDSTAGFVLGGPILRDRLFFFVSYEELTSSRTGLEFGPLGSGRTNVAITPSAITGFQQVAQSAYQFDPGVVDASGSELKVEDALIKLDANIGDNHRASLRWSKTEQTDPIFPTNFNNALSLSSHWYNQDKTLETYVGQLFSDWTENFSTDLKISFRDYASEPINNSNLPQIRLNFSGALPPGSPAVSSTNAGLVAGTERSRHFNNLATETWNYSLVGNWFLDAHELKFGVDYDDNDVYNAFLQDTRGNYTFACINSSATVSYTDPLLAGGVVCNQLTRAQNEAAVLENFRRGRPTSYSVQVGAPGFTLDDGVAEWDYQNLGVFLQDTWTVNYNLTLTAGVRVDQKQMNTRPLFNQAAAAATVEGTLSNATTPQTGTVTRASGGFGLRNDVTLDGNSLFQPRFGFNYTFNTDRPTQLRGGFGLFEGAAANVWLSNPYSNTGLATRVVGCGISGFSACPPAGGLFTPNPGAQRTDFAGAIPAANVDFLSPDLQQPAVWKANLAFEHELPGGVVATIEYIRTQVDSAIYYRHLNLGRPTLQSATDGRNMFWSPQGLNTNCFQNTGATISSGACSGIRQRALNNPNFNNVTVAERTTAGSGDNLSLGFNGRLWDDFSWGLAYSFTRATEVSQLSSSVANSNWQSVSVFNSNEEVAANSAYLVKDRFIGQLQWRRAFFGDYATSAGLFYEGRRGKPYSWIYNNDLNGDGSTNDLLYIPSGPGSSQVVFRDLNNSGSGADEEETFWAIVRDNGLMQYAGGVAPRNAFFAPWTNSFDLRFSQELPGFFGDHRTSITLDILNVGNLINKRWGRIDEIGFQAQGGLARSFVNYLGVDAQGRYVYGVNGQVEDFVTRQARGESQWAAQITLRYAF